MMAKVMIMPRHNSKEGDAWVKELTAEMLSWRYQPNYRPGEMTSKKYEQIGLSIKNAMSALLLLDEKFEVRINHVYAITKGSHPNFDEDVFWEEFYPRISIKCEKKTICLQ